MSASASPISERPKTREIFHAFPFALRIIYDAYPFGFVLLFVIAFLYGPINTVNVIALKYLTDALAGTNMQRALFWVGVLITSAIVNGVMNVFRERESDKLRYLTEVALQRKNLEYLSSLPYIVFEDASFQTLSAAYTQKSYVLLNVQNALPQIVGTVFSLIGLSAAFAFLPWPVIALIGTSQIILFFLYRKAAEWSWNVLSHESREGRRAIYYQNTFSDARTLLPARASELNLSFFGKWQSLVQSVLQLKLKETNSGALAIAGSELVEAAGFGTGLFLMVRSVLTGTVQLSSAVVFVSSFRQFSAMLGGLTGHVRWLLKEAAFLPVLKKYYAFKPETDAGRRVPKDPLTIEFRDVWFRYPGTAQYILRGVSLTMTEGEHIALVGLNGAGKTTLLKLLMRIYKPTRGVILVNGISLSKIKASSWRRALAVLSQEPPRYDDTLEAQVLYGDPTSPLDRGRIERASRASGLTDVLKEIPKGMAAHAGKRYAMPEDEAIELSGGQNQILAIARTLYRNSRIYIFDEPTSAVDAEKEERFFEALPEATQGRAVIFVSHRFSTLRRAQRIIVLDQGRVLEDGTHEELMFKQGKYAELFTLQAKMYQ